MIKKQRANEQLCGTMKNTCVWWNNNDSNCRETEGERQIDKKTRDADRIENAKQKCDSSQPAVIHKIYFVVFVAYVFVCVCCSSGVTLSLPLLPQRTSVRSEFILKVKTDDFCGWTERRKNNNKRTTTRECLVVKKHQWESVFDAYACVLMC